MHLFGSNIDFVYDEINKLKEELNKSGSISDRKSCVASIDFLNSLINYSVKFKFNLKRFSKYYEFANKYDNKYLTNFINNREFYIDFLFNASKCFSKEVYKYESCYYEETFCSEDAAVMIIHDFFNRYYPNYIDYVDSMISDGRILLKSMEDFYDGICFFLYKFKPIIFIEDVREGNINLDMIVCVIHELGHAIEGMIISDNFSSNYFEKFISCSNRVEFISKLFELQSIEYLHDLGINKNYTYNILVDFYSFVYRDLVDAYILSTLPSDTLKKGYFKEFDVEYVNDYITSIAPFVKEEWGSLMDVELRESVTYGISGLLATYCNGIIKEDHDYGMNLFNNILRSRNDVMDYKYFDNLNINKYELNKCLRKELNHNGF